MFLAYLITCRVTGKQYVGITSRGIARRWTEHLFDSRASTKRMVISRAIAKHGADTFTIEAICSAKSWADLCAIENILIGQYGTRTPAGYNLSDGGAGPFGVRRSPESVEASAAKHRGLPCHPNTRAAATLAHKGKPKSADHRAKIGAALVGKARSAATKAKLSAYWAERRARGEFKTTEPYAHTGKGRAWLPMEQAA